MSIATDQAQPRPVHRGVGLVGLVSMQVFDSRGRQVYNEVFQANGNKTQRTLDLSALASGTYTVQVENNDGRVSQRVVVR